MNRQKPFLSVIIPVHNTATTLQRCVDSVINQRGIDIPLEIILVENGSTDRSLSLCKEIEKKHQQVRVFTNTPAGLPEARNRGIKESRGEWVAFLDSDDYISPDFFQRFFDAQKQHDADMIYCNFVDEWDSGKTVSQFPDTGSVTLKTPDNAAADILLDLTTSSACTRLYPREFFNTRSFPEGIIFEDHSVMFRWVSECRRPVYIDMPLYHYCHSAGTITSDAMTTNTGKMLQYIAANMRRLDFIDSYRGFAKSVKEATLRHNLGIIIMTFKQYTGAVSAIFPTDTAEQKKLSETRRTIISLIRRFGARTIGRKHLAQLLRIRFFWDSFRKKQTAKYIRNHTSDLKNLKKT